MKRRGFTLIELIMVIVILGILAAVAIPRYIDLSSQAKLSAAKGSIGSIRAALAIEYAKTAAVGTPTFPTTITGDLFADGSVPPNQLAGSLGASHSQDVVTTWDGKGGWVYYRGTDTASVESNDSARTQL